VTGYDLKAVHRAEVDGNATFAVIVTYFPDLALLEALLEAIQRQVVGIVVIDNGSPPTTIGWLRAKQSKLSLILRPLGENKGVAHAQNCGLAVAQESGAENVVLFDQDSRPTCDIVARLLEALLDRQAAGTRVAAVGARYLDPRQNNPTPFIRIEGLRLRRQCCGKPGAVVQTDYLISSGCLIPLAALKAVGGLRDELFIDYVDIEWGLRAKSKGYFCFGACNATMLHDLGGEPIRFLRRSYPCHSPLRHFYHFRNAVWMYRQPWVPFNWKCVDAFRLLLKYGFYSLLAKPRLEHWWMMTKGIGHGLSGSMGRLK
jgi:rhamnosyltransferase